MTDWRERALARPGVREHIAAVRAEWDAEEAEELVVEDEPESLREDARITQETIGDLNAMFIKQVKRAEEAEAKLAGVAIHANRFKTWLDDDKASITVAGSILGDLFAALDAPEPQFQVKAELTRERAHR